MVSISEPNNCMPIGRSYSKMSSFITLLAASLISPSDEMNSVYIISAPSSLQTARNGGSLTSSIGASNNGKSPNSMFPILIIVFCSVNGHRSTVIGHRSSVNGQRSTVNSQQSTVNGQRSTVNV